MTPGQELIDQLRDCPRGAAGWMKYEQTCLAIGTYLFVPPLGAPIVQPRTRSGTERRDAVFPNWNFDLKTPWGILRQEHRAHMVVFEYKNLDERLVGNEEVNQVRSYLKEPMGGLAILCSRERPSEGAHVVRNGIYKEEKKVILFVTDDDFMKMLDMKAQGADPAEWILHLVAEFYVGYE